MAMRNIAVVSIVGLFALTLLGCTGGTANNAGSTSANGTPVSGENNAPSNEPKFITVQHILIGFAGSVPGKPIERTKEEAEALAKQILEQARMPGAEFGQLVSKHTDDQYPGIYQMANNHVKPNEIPTGYMARNKLVPAFGDVGFPLQVNEVGLAAYHPGKSPYGWHIIKRVE